MNAWGRHGRRREREGERAADRLDDVVIGGRYRLVSLLGEGGVAVVWRARDMRTGGHRAVKLLAPGRGGWSRRGMRLLREARVMTRLRHENIVSVHDVGDGPHGPWFAMDLVPGGSVESRIRREGRVAPVQALTWALDALRGLDAAHRHGVIHRDVKPSNLLVDTTGRVLVADFGIALVDDAVSRDTRTGATLGSMMYMAPEQRLDARRVGPEADLYAIGASIYHAISGTTPMDLFLAEPDSPRWLEVPPALVPALQRAVRVEPERRYRSAAAFADDLAAILEGLPEDDGLWERGQHDQREHTGTLSLDGVGPAVEHVSILTEGTVIELGPEDDDDPSEADTRHDDRPRVPLVLVVDDDAIQRRVLSRWLELGGYRVATAESGRDAIRAGARLAPDLVLLDLYMEDMDGFAVMEAFKAMRRPPRVVMMTADDEVHTVVRAMRAGAVDYMTKPLQQAETLARLGTVLAEGKPLTVEEQEDPETFEGLVARSPLMRSLFRTVERTARRTAPVLILGPAGSGKSHVAQAIHARGPRRSGPFISVRCAGLVTPEVVERVLGRPHLPGQLPPMDGALADAVGGTLLLEDVDRIPLDVQPAVARLLAAQGRPVREDETEAEPDVRVIATTQTDLPTLVAEERFHPDLLERLSAFEVRLPALTDRGEDLSLLTDRLGRSIAEARGRRPPRFTAAAAEAWYAHDWPGNVAELRAALEHVLARADAGVVRVEHLPPTLHPCGPNRGVHAA